MTLDQDNQQKRPRNLLFILFEDSALILKLYGATGLLFRCLYCSVCELCCYLEKEVNSILRTFYIKLKQDKTSINLHTRSRLI